MSERHKKTALTGARIFTGSEIISDHAVLLTSADIDGICENRNIPPTYRIMDLNGGLLAPGFIDLQVNGGGGVLFNDNPAVETIAAIIAAHRPFGTTGLLATLISDSMDRMRTAWAAVQSGLQQDLPGLLGIHLEGPWLNKLRKGVHDETALRPFDDGIFDLIATDAPGANMMTLAPETLAEGVIKRLIERGLRISAGHTAASYEQTRQALAEGVSGFTHLFNAMTPLTSRAPGVVGAALEDTGSYCGIIVDGHHVHPASLKIAIAAKAAGRMMLVTDAMPPVGTADKSFRLGEQTITVENGRCITAEGVLAGSSLDMITAVRNCVHMLDLPVEEALRMASLYPATYLGLEGRRGRIKDGYRADLVHLSDDLEVIRTWIGGQSRAHSAGLD